MFSLRLPNSPSASSKLSAALVCFALFASSCSALSQTSAGNTQPPLTNPGSGGDPATTTLPVEDPAADPTTTAPPADDTTTTTAVPTQDPAVAQILAGYTTWTDPGLHVTDNRSLQTDQWFDEGGEAGREKVSCAPSQLPTVVREMDEFPAFGFSGDDVLPGLIVDGSAATTGNIRALPLNRSPFTLRSSLASANPTVVVDDPNSGTIAEAVATLKRDADPRLGSIDVTQSDIKYDSEETHSFEHSSLEVGVSMRYRNRLVSAGLDADYSQQKSVERHTITVQMVQRQLTLSMVDDSVSNPGQYFGVDVTGPQVDALIASGAIGSENPPMVINRVAYGRMMYFTMSSTNVSSSQELRAAVDAVKGKYEGSATVDAAHLETINSSEISMVAYGGDQNLALAAIRTGDLSQFFGSANPTTAAPLAFTFNTLNGGVVQLKESADIQALTCQRTPAPYEFAMKIDSVQGKLKIFVNNAEVMAVEDNNPVIGKKKDGSATLDGSKLNKLLKNGSNEIRLRYTNLGCDNRFRVRVFDGPNLPSSLSNPIESFSHPDWNECIGKGDMTLKFTINTGDRTVNEI